MLKDVNAEKTQLTDIIDSLEKTLAERDDEICSLKTEASLIRMHCVKSYHHTHIHAIIVFLPQSVWCLL